MGGAEGEGGMGGGNGVAGSGGRGARYPSGKVSVGDKDQGRQNYFIR